MSSPCADQLRGMCACIRPRIAPGSERRARRKGGPSPETLGPSEEALPMLVCPEDLGASTGAVDEAVV